MSRRYYAIELKSHNTDWMYMPSFYHLQKSYAAGAWSMLESFNGGKPQEARLVSYMIGDGGARDSLVIVETKTFGPINLNSQESRR